MTGDVRARGRRRRREGSVTIGVTPSVQQRLTKICATIGPATREPEALDALIAAGMDIARLNFSHGTLEEHHETLRRVRAAAARAERPVAVMQDLQGPRIRVRGIRGEVELQKGQRVLLVPKGAHARGADGAIVLPVSYARLHKEVGEEQRVLLRDGTIQLRVKESRRDGLLCLVERPGRVQPGAGLNVPDAALNVPALTARDREHIAAGAAMGFDAVALSFVRDAEDLRRARRLLEKAGSDALIVAKIERSAALMNLDEILAEADGVIVARGDLGVECPIESVPLLQKEIIRRSTRACTFVITATQMLESMTHSATPTRAEVSDVANAVLDGSDAVMLSAETAVGRFPDRAVGVMDRIARTVEADAGVMVEARPHPEAPPDDFVPAITAAAVKLVEQSSAAALVAFTDTGRTAAILAFQRPRVPIVAFTTSPESYRRLAFYRGVHARMMKPLRLRDEVFAYGVETLLAEGVIRSGQVVVLLGGHKFAHASANSLKVHRVDET